MITKYGYLKLKERYKSGYRWIARDRDDECVYVYKSKPIKLGFTWGDTEPSCYEWSLNDDSFPCIKWEDEKPTRIDDLIRDYESHQIITGGNNSNKAELVKEIEEILDDIGVSDYQLGEYEEDTIWAISSITIREIFSAIEKHSLDSVKATEVEKEKLYTVDLNFNQALGKRNGVIKFYDPNEKFWIVERKLTQAEIESVNPILMQIAKEVE